MLNPFILQQSKCRKNVANFFFVSTLIAYISGINGSIMNQTTSRFWAKDFLLLEAIHTHWHWSEYGYVNLPLPFQFRVVVD